jgi:heme/copper-type cytochrome/quinol oxidase subunit 2
MRRIFGFSFLVIAVLGVALIVYGIVDEASMPAGQTDSVDLFGMTLTVELICAVVGSLTGLVFGTSSYLLLRHRSSKVDAGRREPSGANTHGDSRRPPSHGGRVGRAISGTTDTARGRPRL